jgi:predicted nucleotidyltransferase
MLKNLFSSEVRIKLLTQFLIHPDQEFYLRELSKRFQVSPRQVSLELSNLHKIEFIKKRISGNQHFYSVNQQHPLFSDLLNIFIKTVGLKDVLWEYMSPFSENIVYCFVYGSIAKGNAASKSDIDLMIIGSIDSKSLSGPLLKAGQKLEREINYSVFPLKEVENRLRKKDHFFTTLLSEPKIFIVGDLIEFERVGEEWLAETT